MGFNTRTFVVGGVILGVLWYFGALTAIQQRIFTPPGAIPPANPIPPQQTPTGAPMGGCPPQLSGSQCLSYLEAKENTAREAGWQGVAGNLGGSLLKGLGVG